MNRARVAILSGCVLLGLNTAVFAAGTFKVFVLAGQSNMEGKARNSLLEFQATDAKTKDFYAPFRKDGKWIERDDVFITFLNRQGPLTIGYGSPSCTGSELKFGWMLGDHLDEPVLLIKAAWGGHSLFKNFRPPSASLSDERLEQELEKAKASVAARNKKHNQNKPMPTMEALKEAYGASYRNMMAEIERVLGSCETLFPALKGRKPEMAGFFWFQGFNDQFGEIAPDEYRSNMKHFINDVRKDLKAPKLPFVIAAIGTFRSSEPRGGTLGVLNGQMGMNDVPEFKGNVKAFETAPLVDKAADALINNWQDHVEEWKKVGSDRPYHYLGSGIWYSRIGQAAGEAMLEMMKD
ncbi:MAG: sialate O-acetylesterase [Kiritimatiellia bacterium]|nr:sialate O-acetylesterase [Kiritimatiellia bacterium]